MELYYKQMAMNHLERELDVIRRTYPVIYDRAKLEDSRDAEFIKDFTNILIHLAAVMEVYTRDGHIDAGYARQKIMNIKGHCEANIRYWERKGGLINE